MRASKDSSKFEVPFSRSGKQKNPFSEHISGAEGIYEAAEIEKIASEYVKRALGHPRGVPDRIIITAEKILVKPRMIASLPVVTLRSETPEESMRLMGNLLMSLGISLGAIRQAFRILQKSRSMRGAAFVLLQSGRRAEPDRQRGVRVSRLGISKGALRSLSQRLSRREINTATVQEAIILASKVASCKDIQAEVCMSDDPDYTTGYVSSKKTGYVRIPHIKKPGDRRGGRIFFLREEADIVRTIAYLEQRPVIVSTVSACRGEVTYNEFIDSHHR